MLVALLFILSADVLDAQTFTILNPKVSQGDVVIVRIAPQFQVQAQGSPVCIFIEWQLNDNNFITKHYSPNQYGDIFVGISVDIKPGKYPVYRIECGRGIRLDPIFYERIEVLEKRFPETKIKRKIVAVDSVKRKKEARLIQDAYARANSWIDYTKGDYRPPLDIVLITDEFGKKRNYLNGQTRHVGVDLKAVNRTSVKAVNSGIVLLVVENFSLEGNMIILDHGSGILSLYLHLSKINVKQGAKVNGGEIVGLSGSTGSATGPHLHLILKANNVNVDPFKFIDLVNKYLN